ncbi:hypothetical protein LSAT2_026189, partial [Lamellibrachia satsuma]
AICLLWGVKLNLNRRSADSLIGFRERKGCRDNLFILRQTVDDVVAARESTVCVYVY